MKVNFLMNRFFKLFNAWFDFTQFPFYCFENMKGFERALTFGNIFTQDEYHNFLGQFTRNLIDINTPTIQPTTLLNE
jgi:hypothetical protein